MGRGWFAAGAVLSLGVLARSVVACGSDGAAQPQPTSEAGVDGGVDAAPTSVTVRILAINDFHGALQADSAGLGGAANLAAHLADSRTENSIIVSAGDVIGGSPLISGAYHDEGTIEAMNAIGLAYNGVGNHEFDEGLPELLRMQNGGCHPVDGCVARPSFAGAKFEFLAANAVDRGSGKTIFPPYEIRDFSGAKIAFVGMTLKNTPATTVASLVSGIDFKDEIDTMNALVPEIRAKGTQNVVLLVHQGSATTGPYDLCVGLDDRISKMAMGMPPEVKLVVSAHTHAAYNCKYGDKLVTSAGSQGKYFTRADLTIDLATQAVTNAVAKNFQVQANLPPDPAVADIVAHYEAIIAPVRDRVIGTITGDVTGGSAAGESRIGDLVADAMLLATSAAPANAQIAFMNGPGLRATFGFAKSGAETVDGQVTFGEAFAVQPFANTLTTIGVSGSDIVAFLEKFAGVAQVAGLTYTWQPNAPMGSRVDPADVLVGGVAIVVTDTYRVTVNTIFYDATSGTPAFAQGANPIAGGVDLDALVAYFAARSPVTPSTLGRIQTK